jgi:tetratricopeptide (TPR) repeat protein
MAYSAIMIPSRQTTSGGAEFMWYIPRAHFAQIAAILMLFSVLSLPFAGYAEDTVSEAQRLLGFADHLKEEGDYYRAITEYKRFIFYYPEHPEVPLSKYKIGLCYMEGERWEEARGHFATLKHDISTALAFKAWLKEAECHYREKNYAAAIIESRSLLDEVEDKDIKDDTYKILGWSHMELENWQAASAAFGSISHREAASLMAKEILAGEDLPEKSPTLAGILSGVLPGAGQLYCGRYGDAITAFLLNAAFIGGAISSFHSECNWAGGILLFFESGWYLGNIYSAITSAHKYNQRQKREFIQQLKEGFHLDVSSTRGKLFPKLVYRIRF